MFLLIKMVFSVPKPDINPSSGIISLVEKIKVHHHNLV